VRAEVAALDQFSDHADTPELLQWLRTFKHPPKLTHLVHGEPAASQALKSSIQSELRWNVQIASYMQKVPIP
jgi:metallo-beta-lactamase family protein